MGEKGKESCVLWGADPLDKNRVRVGPGVEATKFESKLEFHIEEVVRNGHTVLENCFLEEELRIIRDKIDSIYQQQAEEIGGEDKLLLIGDELSVKHLLVYDEIFLKMATHKDVLAIIEGILGDHFILQLQNGILNKSNIYHSACDFHRDLFFQHFTASSPLALSAVVCVDDFDSETGGTFVLPGSHKFDRFPSPEFAQKYQFQVTAKAGSVIVFDSMVYHRTGENTSSSIRRAVSQVYTLPFLKQQISLPKALGGKYSEDPFLFKFLGYKTETRNNVLEWRQERIKLRGDGKKRGRPLYGPGSNENSK
jgi:ectoine hydroxylase-related dioxygenase (phytanoyl-CoA dioxygenase family)